MSYIAFDLDMFNSCSVIADALEVHRRYITDGILALRVHCTRAKTDEVNIVELTYFFPRHRRLESALLDFGFIEQTDQEGIFLVPSMTQYLKSLAKKQGGAEKARAKKGITGKTKKSVKSVTKKVDDQIDDQIDHQQMINLMQVDLTPNTYKDLKSLDADASVPEAAQKEKSREPEPPQLVSTLPASFDLIPTAPPPPKKVKPPPDPRKLALKEKLKEAYLARIGHAYLWQNVRDNVALDSLCKENNDDEIIQRFLTGLNATGWKQIRGVAQLLSKWNDLATEQRSALTVERSKAKPCVICGNAAATDIGGKGFCYPHFGEAWDEVGPVFHDSLEEKKKQGIGFEEWQAVCVEEWLGARQT